jgi:hypothetical protein
MCLINTFVSGISVGFFDLILKIQVVDGQMMLSFYGKNNEFDTTKRCPGTG